MCTGFQMEPSLGLLEGRLLLFFYFSTLMPFLPSALSFYINMYVMNAKMQALIADVKCYRPRCNLEELLCMCVVLLQLCLFT